MPARVKTFFMNFCSLFSFFGHTTPFTPKSCLLCSVKTLLRRPRLVRNLSIGFSPTQTSHRSKLRVAVGTAVACRPPHRPARAVFLHAVLTADTWRRSAGRGTDGGFGAGEATVQRNQSCASTSSGFSGYDVGGFVASVCSLHAESARD